MTTTLEPQTFNIEITNLTLMNNNSFEKFISEAIDSSSDEVIIRVKHGLISQGKDNIQTRIHIKKAFKVTIANLESLIKEAESNKGNKEIVKSLRSKFLTIVSILDKLQLEWQKHDLSIRL